MSEASDNLKHEPEAARGRKQLAVIFLVAGLSMGGAYLAFYLASTGTTWGTTNNGTLVTPHVTVADLGLLDSAGQPAAATGRWWLWTVVDGDCADDCLFALERLRAVHALLNRDAGRVSRALIAPSPVAAGVPASEYPDLQRLEQSGSRLATGIYIVDPLGNLVLRYPLSDAGEPVLKDLKKLLKVSQIG